MHRIDTIRAPGGMSDCPVRLIAARTPHRRHRRGGWRGFIAIEMFGALFVLALGLGLIAAAYTRSWSETLEQIAAQHLRTFHQAADGYVRSNYNALVTATAGGPVAVTVAQLVTAGYLDPGVAATGFINPFSHVPVAWIRTVTCVPACANRLELVSALRSGKTLSRLTATGVAVRANGAGTNAGFIVASAPSTLVRVFGAGTVDLTPYAALGLPGAGHVAAVSFYDGSQLAADWLARHASSNPEENRMRTAIDMTGNDITNGGNFYANDIELTGKGNQWASAAIASASIVAAGQSVTKPTCPHGTPAVYTAVTNAAADAVGTLWSSVQTWAVDAGATWTINIRVRTATGWVTPADGFGNVLALAKCD